MSSSSEGDDVELARGVGEGRLPAPSSSHYNQETTRNSLVPHAINPHSLTHSLTGAHVVTDRVRGSVD